MKQTFLLVFSMMTSLAAMFAQEEYEILVPKGIQTFESASAWIDADAPLTYQQEYCNSRYGFCVKYPANLFRTAKTPHNQGGLSLETASEDATISLYGFYDLDWTADDLLELMTTSLEESYKRVRVLEFKKIDEKNVEVLFAIGKQQLYYKTFLQEDRYIAVTIRITSKEISTLAAIQKSMLPSLQILTAE